MTTGTKVFWIILATIWLVLKIIVASKKAKHYQRIRAAKKIYKNINKIKNSNEGWLIKYLRKIDPFVFEELILLSFKNKGYHIKRNKRYTHDGGIDGRISKNGEKFLIQAKRYSDYINEKHVRDFIEVCHENKCKGFFIHTGKTGKETKELLIKNSSIVIISGKKLFDLFIKESN